jgi:hypothetical protein
MDNGNSTVARTPAPGCPACAPGRCRRHTAYERSTWHLYAGHGYTKESGWTHPDLEPHK